MKDLIILAGVLVLFGGGFFVMTRLDRYFANKVPCPVRPLANGGRSVRIGAEGAGLLDAVVCVLCEPFRKVPPAELVLSCGKLDSLLRKLQEHAVDIALLAEEHREAVEGRFAYLRIPYRPAQTVTTSYGLQADNEEDDRWLYVVWDEAIKSDSRDRVLSVLEREFCTMRSGYCDYMD